MYNNKVTFNPATCFSYLHLNVTLRIVFLFMKILFSFFFTVIARVMIEAKHKNSQQNEECNCHARSNIRHGTVHFVLRVQQQRSEVRSAAVAVYCHFDTLTFCCKQRSAKNGCENHEKSSLSVMLLHVIKTRKLRGKTLTMFCVIWMVGYPDCHHVRIINYSAQLLFSFFCSVKESWISSFSSLEISFVVKFCLPTNLYPRRKANLAGVSFFFRSFFLNYLYFLNVCCYSLR